MSSPIRPASPDSSQPDSATPYGPARWRVRRPLAIAKAAGAVLFLAAGLTAHADRIALVIGIGGAIILAAFAVRDIAGAERLAVDQDGVTVLSGYLGRHRLAWAEIERIRVDRRSRLGLRTEMVEIDAGESIYLFSANDLSAAPDEVVRHILALRTAGEPRTAD